MDANPTLDQLRVFLAVVEEGSFSGAARRLNRSQSVISYAIANLEAQLDLRLFDRAGTRQPRLTDAGGAVLEDARRMDGDLRLLRARAQGLRQGLEARLSVAVDALVPTPVLMEVLQAFHGAFPTVGIALLTGVLGAVGQAVVQHEADVGIGADVAAGRDDIVSRRIGRHRMIPVAAPAHPLAVAGAKRADSVPLAKEQVRAHVQIVIADPTERSRGRDFRVHAVETWRVADLGTKHALQIAGLGWGGLPRWLVEDDLRAGRLVELALEPYPPADYWLYALRSSDRPYGPAGSWLVERFADGLDRF